MTRGSEFQIHKVGAYAPRSLADAGSESYRYRIGYVVTPDGVVGVYTQADLTHLAFARDGYEVTRRWERSFTERRLITLCRQFAADALAELSRDA